MPDDRERAAQLAARIVAKVPDGFDDPEGTLFTPDCVFWRNNDPVDRPIAKCVDNVEFVRKRIPDFRADRWHQRVFDDGALLEFSYLGTSPEGNEFDVPACLILTIADGLITRVDEYIDNAPIVEALHLKR